MSSKESVTVLVFKDNYASRSFQLPLRWFSRLGMLLGALLALAVGAGLIALKYYRLAGQGIVAEAGPAPTVTVTVTAPPSTSNQPAPPPLAQPAPVSQAAPGLPLLFSALPSGTLPIPTEKASVPIAITSPSVHWNGRKLTVKFDLQYVAEDKGTQQGRIILIARGPELVTAYPAGVFAGSDKPSLLDPAKGEYFSVSRLRNTVAEFGPFNSRLAVTEVEAIVLSSTGQLLIHEVIPVKNAPSLPVAPAVSTGALGATPAAAPLSSPAAGAPKTAPSKAALPDASGGANQKVEPGYDQ